MIFSRTWLVFIVLGMSVAGVAEDSVVSSCASEPILLQESEVAPLGLVQSSQVKRRLHLSANETGEHLQPAIGARAALTEKTGKHLQPATGASAALTETGYLIVSGQCCNYEMSEYIRRVAFDNGLQVCNEGGLQGVTPYYSCTYGPKSLSELKEYLSIGPILQRSLLLYPRKNCCATLIRNALGLL